MFNWRATPFVRLLIPLITGICLASYFNIAVPFYNLIFISLLLLLGIVHSRKISYRLQWLPGLLINATILLLGYQIAFLHNELNHDNHFQHYLSDSNIVCGKIVSPPSEGNWIKMQVSLEQIGEGASGLNACDGKLLVYIQNDSLSRLLDLGTAIILKARIQKIKGPGNPHAFDYRKYLAQQNIHYQAFVRSDQWQRAALPPSPSISGWAHRSREAFLRVLRKHIATPNEQAVGQALILGYRQGIDSELRNAYANTGAMHVLAVSGLHVGLVYLGLAFLLGLLPFRQKWWTVIKVILLLAGVWCFALLTGASASVLRAATMFSFLIVGTNLKRQPDIYNVLAASAFCLLCINPYLLMEVGFQLSYLAVTGIVYFQPKVYRLWIIDNKFGDYLWKLVAVAIAAQITTLPLSLYYFHQFPLYFWLSGIVVIPAATLILGSGMLLLFTAYTLPFLTSVVAYILYGIIWLMNALIFLIQQIPGQLISGIWISVMSMVLLYFILFFIAMMIESQKVKWLFATMITILILGVGYNIKSINQLNQRQLTIYQIKGNSLIDFVNGRKVYSLKNNTVPKTQEDFAVRNHRMAIGTEQVENISFDREKFVGQDLYFQNGMAQFFKHRMAFLRELPATKSNTAVALHSLVICNDFKSSPGKLFQFYNPGIIVLDGSNSFRNRQYWKETCADVNIPVHDIVEDGALTFKLYQ